MRLTHLSYCVPVPGCVLILLLGLPAYGHEADLAGPHTHKVLTAVIIKIKAGLMFIQPTISKRGLQPRAVSINKAERMGLHKVRVGDEVLVTVDEGNVLLDIHEKFEQRMGAIKIAAPNSLCSDILSVTGVGSYFEVFPEVQSAVGSFTQ